MNELVLGYIEGAIDRVRLYPGNRLHRSHEFESLLESSETDLTDISDLESILEIVSIQCGDWFARWACSPASRPDIDARTEFDNWELLWRTLARNQPTEFCDWAEVVTNRHFRQRDIRLLRHVDRMNGARFRSRILVNCCYWVSRYLSSIGLNWIANKLFSRSMYPGGSVGREL